MRGRMHRVISLLALLAGMAAADEDWRALHNHSRHARQDILHADRQPPPVRPVPGRHRLADSERAAFRLWCLESDRCTGVRPAEDFFHLPPGLRKQLDRDKPLPAGWESRLRPGQRIDPRILAHSQPVPPDVLQALPSQPRNTFLITIDGRLVKIARSSSIILDVFQLEF